MDNKYFITQLLKAAENMPDENNLENKWDQILNRLSEIESYQKSPDNTNEHLLIDDVCRLTRKSRVTVWTWRKNKLLLPVGMSGRSPLYLKSDVLNFLYSQN